MLRELKREIVKVIYSYYKKDLASTSVSIIFDKECTRQKEIINRVEFFFEKYNIKYKISYNPLVFPLFRRNIKLFAGFSKPKRYTKQSFLSFNVDPLTNPQDGWEYHKVLSLLVPFDEVDKSKNKLAVALNNCKNHKLDKVYLFGTGSSLASAINHDCSDGYKIVCNTIVKDAELWHHINPDFIVAADAIYHFGDNLFAKAFCNDLEKRLSETLHTCFVYPSLFHPFVKKRFAKFEERLIPIPLGTHKDICNNLLEKFELPSLGNVLNNMLLPLGTNLSKNIYLWGFNGRAPDDKDFWKNSDKHFYNELVDDIKKSHPYFYEYFIPKGNEEKYVKKYHGDELEQSLEAAESKGWQFTMLHASYTPALAKRFKA